MEQGTIIALYLAYSLNPVSLGPAGVSAEIHLSVNGCKKREIGKIRTLCKSFKHQLYYKSKGDNKGRTVYTRIQEARENLLFFHDKKMSYRHVLKERLLLNISFISIFSENVWY